MKPRRPLRAWEHLSDDDLLEVRICDLGVRIAGTDLEPRVEQLYRELADEGLGLRPPCYLATEWLCPDGHAAIGIPFFLAHPRLRSLEFRMMFDVEGGTTVSCMRLLRHEAGHAFDHAYRLYREPGWKRLFGSASAPYNPYYYTVDPHSKNHVRNVPNDYSQCHPSEDFAETFAVWLNPSSHWRTRYRNWPAMRKLRYVDRIMDKLSGKQPPARKPELQSEARLSQSTLKSYYERKFRLYQFGDLAFAVRDLKKIFRETRASNPTNTAGEFIRRHKRHMVDAIAAWSGARSSRVGNVLTRLARLSDEHDLVVRDEPDFTLVRISTYAATLINNQIGTHYFRKSRP